MPISAHLTGDYQPDAEAQRVMGVALEMTLAALRLADRSDAIVGTVAGKIIELAKSGETNADRLCEQTLTSLGPRGLWPALRSYAR